MWQRFTERARSVVFFAQEEAGRLGENSVATEHLLLGLVRENDSVAARILTQMGVSLERIRSEVERQVQQGDGLQLGKDMMLTPRSKRVIDLAYDEARQLNNNYIGTEHLLLGLIREGMGLAGRVLDKLGVDLERTRAEIAKLQDEAVNQGGASAAGAPDIARRKRGRGSKEPQAPPDDVLASKPALRRGYLAVLRNADSRPYVELVPDANDIGSFITDVMELKDEFAYRDMVKSGKVILLPAETPVKFLERADMDMVLVRVLDGAHAGKTGYVNESKLQDVRPDDRPFPPEISDQPDR